ncbi:MAG: glycosyltransferase [Burkholderiales bacterium]
MQPTVDVVILPSALANKTALVDQFRNIADATVRTAVLADNGSIDWAATLGYSTASATPNRDLVLLDADVQVPEGWLARMRATADENPDAASVSPWGNDAFSTSYPLPGQSNPAPDAAAFTRLNQLLQNTFAPSATTAPTLAAQDRVIPVAGYGCTYITAEALQRVGFPPAFSSSTHTVAGAPDLLAWSLAATSLGMTHVLAAGLYVAKHQALDRHLLTDSADATDALIDGLRYGETLRVARRRVDWARLQSASERPRVLMITHRLGGGVEKHINDLAQLSANTFDTFVLRPDDEGQVCVAWASPGEDWKCWFSVTDDWDAFVEWATGMRFARIHVHHVEGVAQSIWQLAAKLSVPLDITVHDHWPVSPDYHLSRAGSVDANAEAQWQAATGKLLASAARVFVPSEYIASQVRRVWPNLSLTLWPHPEAAYSAPRAVTKVGIPGRLSPEKGLDVVLACAEYAQANALPLIFEVIGPTTRPLPTRPALPISITGSYADAELGQLLVDERIDVVWIPSQVPESFSYTLSTALRSGLAIVASDIGALTERLRNQANAQLLPSNASAGEWCAALLRVATQTATPHPSNAAASTETQMAAYLSPLRDVALTAATALPPPPPPPLRVLRPARKIGEAQQFSLVQLYEYGVDCGQAEARAQLRRQAGEAETRIQQAIRQYQLEQAHRLRSEQELGDALRREVELSKELNQHIANLDAHIDELGQRIAALEVMNEETLHVLELTTERLEHERDAARAAFNAVTNSTSWRITAPLRSVMHAIKSMLRLTRETADQSKALPHKVAVAAQILREEGPVALGKRVHEKLSRTPEAPKPKAVLYTQEKSIEPLTFADAPEPLVSVVIPVYGQHLMTYTCLKSIQETCAHLAIEVIIMDDCSPEPAADALAPVSGIRIIRNANNLGFLRNCNAGAAVARGQYVLILNNDIIVTPGWLDAMLETFTLRDNVGMVGAKLIYPDGTLQEAGGIVWRDGSAWNWGRNQDASLPPYNYLREADYCSGACLLLEREFWNALGGFDERYVPAYYEDTDLAFRVREHGRKLYYQPRAVVVHFEGQSSGTDLTQGVKKHQVINQQTFLSRWRNVLANHRLNGLLPELECDRYANRRVLVLDACMLTPDQDSGSLRMFEMLGLMAKLGAKVTFLADNLEYREPYVAQIQALGVEVIYHPVHSHVPRWLERYAANYDVIMLSRATVAVKHIDLVKRVAPRARFVFDTVDLHFLRQEREAELANDALQRAAAARMKAQELDLMAKSDVTLVVSPVEQKLLAIEAPAARVSIVSNIHVNMPGPAGFDERSGAIFIGGFRHPPNLDAITWYVENVLPILRARNAGIITTVIGSNAPPALQRFAADDFVIAGFVPDVAPFYQRARMSISPLRYGAGVKGKVNISMQYGVPVVATPPSVEGMYLADGKDVLCAESAESFADAMIRANTDAALWATLRDNGLRNIDEHFSRATASRALAGLLGLPPPAKTPA